MANVHYYTDNRDLPSNRKVHDFEFQNRKYRFTTDDGVFSKGAIDYGSVALLKMLVKEPVHGKLLDMGCGYGTLSVIAKDHFPETAVTSVDVNSRAVELTKLNSELNDTPLCAFVSNQFEQVNEFYDYIITNPPIRAGKSTVYGIFEGAYSHLQANGILMAVVRRQQGAESAMKKLRELFGNCELTDKNKGYWILKCKKEGFDQ